MERLNSQEIVMQIIKEHYQYHSQDSQYQYGNRYNKKLSSF